MGLAVRLRSLSAGDLGIDALSRLMAVWRRRTRARSLGRARVAACTVALVSLRDDARLVARTITGQFAGREGNHSAARHRTAVAQRAGSSRRTHNVGICRTGRPKLPGASARDVEPASALPGIANG